MFVTLFFGVINPDTGVLAHINAGHEPLFIVNSAGAKQRLKSTGPVVGITPDMNFEIVESSMTNAYLANFLSDLMFEH